jgi:MMPL family
MAGVASAPDPFANAASGLVSKDATTAFTPVLLGIPNGEVTEELADDLLATTAPAGRAGVGVAVGGNLGSVLSKSPTESSEVIGLLAAMLILALTFGSLVAMGMPIVTAVLGLATALGLIGLLGHLIKVPTVGPTLATIGLGVGIDYALFLVTRHRDQMAAGVERHESIARAVATSGGAIVFAGGTVIIALLSLRVAGIPLVASLGYASAVAVATAVLAAITLLPAVLPLLGRHLFGAQLPAFLRPRPRPPGAATFWSRWAATVTGHPLACGLVALALLVPLVVPMLSLHLGQEDVGATPQTTTERQAFDLLAARYGPGYNGPLATAVRVHRGPSQPGLRGQVQPGQGQPGRPGAQTEGADGRVQLAQGPAGVAGAAAGPAPGREAPAPAGAGAAAGPASGPAPPGRPAAGAAGRPGPAAGPAAGRAGPAPGPGAPAAAAPGRDRPAAGGAPGGRPGHPQGPGRPDRPGGQGQGPGPAAGAGRPAGLPGGPAVAGLPAGQGRPGRRPGVPGRRPAGPGGQEGGPPVAEAAGGGPGP